MSAYLFQIARKKSFDYLLIIYMKKFLHADWWKNYEMVEQKERTRITQSGKNCAMNCAIQGVHLIWKQKIWLAVYEFLFRDFPVNQFNFVFLHSKNFKFLHCLGLIDILSANQHGEIFSCIYITMQRKTQDCSKVRAARAARLFFFTRLIKFLICGVVVPVSVAVAKNTSFHDFLDIDT